MSTSSMHVAKTGLNAQQTRMQIIANNLANVKPQASSVTVRISKRFSIRSAALRATR